MIDLSVDNKKESLLISSNSNALKKSMPISIVVYSYIVISYLSALRISYFKSLNINNFFN